MMPFTMHYDGWIGLKEAEIWRYLTIELPHRLQMSKVIGYETGSYFSNVSL